MSILSRLLPREAGFFEYFENHDPAYIWVVLCGLLGAIVWDLLTWWWGLPTSSSHALIGGFAGAGVAHAGFGILNWKNIWKAVEFIPLAPLMGMVVGFSLMVGTYWLFRRWRPSSVDRVFRKGQLVSAALYSLGHGARGLGAEAADGLELRDLHPHGAHDAPTAERRPDGHGRVAAQDDPHRAGIGEGELRAGFHVAGGDEQRDDDAHGLLRVIAAMTQRIQGG